MAKELHITIDTFIGTEEKDGREIVGYMDYMLDGALLANPSATDLIVHLDTPGGCTYQGAKLYNRFLEFRNTPGKTVTMINEAMTASYGTVLVQAATPGRRFTRPLARFMVHKPLYSLLEWVNADDLGRLKLELDMMESTLANIYSESTGRPKEEIHEDMRNAVFISAEVALSKGYFDQIIESHSDYEPKKREAKAVAFYNPPKNNNNYIEMTEEQQNSFADKIINGIAGLFKPKNEAEPAPAAASEALENGESLYFEGELQEGTKVFTDEAMAQPAEDGEYTLEDGRVVVVSAGAVQSIAAPAPENSTELEAAQARIAELEKENSELKTKANASATEISNLKNKLKEVPGAKAKAATPPQNHAADTPGTGGKTEHTQAFNNAAEKLKAKYNRK